MRINKWYLLVFVFATLFLISSIDVQAQCSICTRTAQQLGEKPAKALNAGILYLAFVPLSMMLFFAYRWWKKNKAEF